MSGIQDQPMLVQSYQHDQKYADHMQYTRFSPAFFMSWHFEHSAGVPDCFGVDFKTTENN
jgi:hypothetical protein